MDIQIASGTDIVFGRQRSGIGCAVGSLQDGITGSLNIRVSSRVGGTSVCRLGVRAVD
jgi:hypothetical protein